MEKSQKIKKERNRITLKCNVRKQTLEEERRFQMALRLFLTELVRQTLSASEETGT